MHFASNKEHFITLFDSNFLPMGVSLHRSLMQHMPSFHLWIVCMNELAFEQLNALDLPNVTLLPLAEVETEALLAVKPGRSRGEYCWTLTPFTPQFVFDRDSSVNRVTYVDADVFFMDNPGLLLDELEVSGKDVLITPHAYADEYDQSLTSGIFCVQFMSFSRTEGGREVMHWWQDRCIEWCFSRMEDGKFGDQKYLDDWPDRFSRQVHVLLQVEKTLAPWNVKKFLAVMPNLTPVLYHFHSLRIVSPDRVNLFSGYQVGRGLRIYETYLQTLKEVTALMRAHAMPVPFIARERKPWQFLRNLKQRVLKVSAYSDLA